MIYYRQISLQANLIERFPEGNGLSVSDDVELAQGRAVGPQGLVAQDQAVAVVVHVAERDQVLPIAEYSQLT